jgi:hypothetical protein
MAFYKHCSKYATHRIVTATFPQLKLFLAGHIETPFHLSAIKLSFVTLPFALHGGKPGN